MIVWYSAHVTLIQTTAIYAVLGLSFQVALRSGVFSFAGVGFFGLGAYAGADMVKHGVPALVSMAAVTVICAGLGLALAVPLVRLRGLYLGMVTFAFDEILVVVATNGGSLTGGATGLYGIPLVVNTGELVVVAAACALVVSQLERRSTGRAVEALRLDERLARSLGIRVAAQRNLIFAVSAGLGGLAGAMNVFNFSTIAPTGFGFDLIVTGLTMAVVGGVSSWWGVVVGAVMVAWFPNVFAFVGGYRNLVYGVLVVLVIVYEPDGIAGLLRRGARLVRGHMGRRRAGAEGAAVPEAESVSAAKVVRAPMEPGVRRTVEADR